MVVVLVGVIQLTRAMPLPSTPLPSFSPDRYLEISDFQQSEEPVIFEPLKQVRLSRSTYTVTSYLSFQPYKDAFAKYSEYLSDFITDLHSRETRTKFLHMDSTYLRRTDVDQDTLEMTKRKTDAHDSRGKVVIDYATAAKKDCDKPDPKNREKCYMTRQYLDMIDEVSYLARVFERIYMKFLEAINHLEYHPSSNPGSDPTTVSDLPRQSHQQGRKKRNIEEFMIPQDEYQWLDNIDADALENLALTLDMITENSTAWPSRKKRFIFSAFLAIPVWRNSVNVKKIKKNLRILQQNDDKFSKQIKEMTTYMMLHHTQLTKQRTVVMDLDQRLIIMNNTLYHAMDVLTHIRYVTMALADVRTSITRLTTGIMGLKEIVNGVYEYFRVLTSREVTPMVMPPP